MQIDKLFRTYQGIIISLVMIFIAVFGLIFGIIPAIGKIMQIREESIKLSKSNDALQAKVNVLDTIDEEMYRNQLKDLAAAVPVDKSLPTLFSTIDALAQSSGVTVLEVDLTNPGSLATGSAVKQTAEEKKIGSSLMPFTVSVVGSYEQIHAFLAQANNVRRFFRVKEFQISYKDLTNIKVSLGMDAFYSPLVSAAETAASSLDPFTAEEQQIIANIQRMPFAGGGYVSAAPNISAQQEAPRADPFSLQ